jgi:hypothetical protein
MSVEDLIVIVALAEAFLHYFRWRMILGGKELPRVAAYMLGVLGLMLPYTRWLSTRNIVQALEAIKMLWIVIITGGLSVLICYGIDAVVDLAWGKREAEQRERVLMEQRDGKGKSA